MTDNRSLTWSRLSKCYLFLHTTYILLSLNFISTSVISPERSKGLYSYYAWWWRQWCLSRFIV